LQYDEEGGRGRGFLFKKRILSNFNGKICGSEDWNLEGTIFGDYINIDRSGKEIEFRRGFYAKILYSFFCIISSPQKKKDEHVTEFRIFVL